MRPANIITAWADILAGFAVTKLAFFYFESGGFSYQFLNYQDLLWLILCTTGLYGGGVVFNDVFDYRLDVVERPERPLPSGRASYSGAVVLGIVLFLIAVFAGFQVNSFSGKLSVIIAIAALNYNKLAKHNALIGPLNMGVCRGLNLMLGMSVALDAVYFNWFLCLVPIVFIAAITMISRSEVKGGDKITILLGAFFFLAVITGIATLGFYTGYDIFHSIPFLLLFSYMVFKPLIKAYQDPSPANIKKSVRGGILGLIPMNAAIAAGFAGWPYGTLIILLLPVSIFLAKKFAVT